MSQPNEKNGMGLCPLHGEPWVPGLHFGRRSCLFYIPELGASEDYGCPQSDQSSEEAVDA